jgi:multimeric flavodoxin WrbA
MKVLIINSSPRKGGNSETLCREFERGAADAGHETEMINLGNRKMSPCLGCYSCSRTHRCIQHDDMEEILDKMIKADVIMLSTPVYFYSLSAQMKILIDRCFPRFAELSCKNFYLAVTSADTDRDNIRCAVDSMRGFLKCIPGAVEKGVLYGTGAWEKGDIIGLPVMHAAYDAGKTIALEGE